jgi:uncharacterized protein (DUF58 family)
MTPVDIVKKVRRIEIHTRQLVTGAISGAYHSSFKGRGMDFEEVREYAIGDDVRTIDWNVSAKMDRPFVKVFREERELTLMLIVDLSASGSFGSVDQSKRELAAEIASVLAFSATLNNDKVGLILYADTVEYYIPPKKGRRHILRLIRDILYFQPKGRGTQHKVALDYLNRVQTRKTVTFLISDFQDASSSVSQSSSTQSQVIFDPRRAELLNCLSLTNQRHDLISIVLTDPREQVLPNVGLITLEDAETGEVIEVDTGNRSLRERYTQLASAQRKELATGLRKKGLDWIEASTDAPYLPALHNLFNRRANRC